MSTHDENGIEWELCRLSSMAGILEKFPLPRGSAAGELVASGIQQRCSLAEREVRRKKDVFGTQTDVQLQSPA